MVDEKDAFFWSHMAAGSLVVYLTASLEDYILTSVFSTLECAYSLVQSCLTAVDTASRTELSV